MGKIKVNTRYNKDRIEHSVQFDNEAQEYVRQVIELQEKQTKDALKDLGWLSPEESTALRARLEAAERDICEWVNDGDDIYETSCGALFQFNSGSFADNGFVYCYKCGKKITPAPERKEEQK